MMKRQLPSLEIPPIQKFPDPVEITKEDPNIPENVEENEEKNKLLRIWYFCGFIKRRPCFKNDLHSDDLEWNSFIFLHTCKEFNCFKQ